MLSDSAEFGHLPPARSAAVTRLWTMRKSPPQSGYWLVVVARENARPRQSIPASLLRQFIQCPIYSFIKHIRPSWEHVIANLAGPWPGYIWIVTASYNQFMFKKSPGSIFKSVNIEADPSIINHRPLGIKQDLGALIEELMKLS